ncbi:hypothetical protein FHX15_006123 [Rhizobium sp. BK650]|uniref:hypothetical protein n=1 Tax=Rhizobium sp. BK650 TaxID=2586990 RepID=UPI00160C8D6E|nr:hypothetical protein [Rhizobium sp. BK650]MBB3660851.1 hypothetical protein [Rhizobium sp. BK650]
MPRREQHDIELVRTWTLSSSMTMGSSVRAKGILQEIQARLPLVSKKSVSLEGGEITLAMPAGGKTAFNAAVAVVAKALEEAEALPVIPREIEDILGMKTSERHRWLADGRLPSAGMRTVRLAGRARRITFHIFDPKVVEDLLDRGAVGEWRVEDAEARAEKRRKAAYQDKVARSSKKSSKRPRETDHDTRDAQTGLQGWEEFDLDGLLH